MEAPAPIALQAIQRDASGQPVVVENEVIRLRVPAVELYIGTASSAGKGALFITTRCAQAALKSAHSDRNLVWLNDADASKSLSIGFRSIVIHAIAKDTATFPHPCIYCQLDGDNDEDEIRELRFVPTPDISLDGIYAVMNECAALNPDSDADDDDGDDDDNFFWTGAEAPNATAAAQLAHLESVFQAPATNGTADGEQKDDEEEGEDMEA